MVCSRHIFELTTSKPSRCRVQSIEIHTTSTSTRGWAKMRLVAVRAALSSIPLPRICPRVASACRQPLRSLSATSQASVASTDPVQLIDALKLHLSATLQQLQKRAVPEHSGPAARTDVELVDSVRRLTVAWRDLSMCCDEFSTLVAMAGTPSSAITPATVSSLHARLHGAFLALYDQLWSTAQQLYGPGILSEDKFDLYMEVGASASGSPFALSSDKHLRSLALQSIAREAPMLGLAYGCPPDNTAHVRMVMLTGLRSLAAAQRCLNLQSLSGGSISHAAVLAFIRACVRHGSPEPSLPALLYLQSKGWEIRNPEHAALGRCAGIGIRKQLALLERSGAGNLAADAAAAAGMFAAVSGQGKATATAAAGAAAGTSGSTAAAQASPLPVISASEASSIAASIRQHAVILGHLAQARLRRQLEASKRLVEGQKVQLEAMQELNDALEALEAAKKSRGDKAGDGDVQDSPENRTRAEAEATLRAALAQALDEVQAEADDDGDGTATGDEADEDDDEPVSPSSSANEGDQDSYDEASQAALRDVLAQVRPSLGDMDESDAAELLKGMNSGGAAGLGSGPGNDGDLQAALSRALALWPAGSNTGPGSGTEADRQARDKAIVAEDTAERSDDDDGSEESGVQSAASASASSTALAQGTAGSKAASAGQEYTAYRTRFKDAAAGLVHSTCAGDAPEELLTASLSALDELSQGFNDGGKGSKNGKGKAAASGAGSSAAGADATAIVDLTAAAASAMNAEGWVSSPGGLALPLPSLWPGSTPADGRDHTGALATTAAAAQDANSDHVVSYRDAVGSLTSQRLSVMSLYAEYLLGLPPVAATGAGQAGADYKGTAAQDKGGNAEPAPSVRPLAALVDARLSFGATLSVATRTALVAEVRSRLHAGLTGSVWTMADFNTVGAVNVTAADKSSGSSTATATSPAAAADGNLPPVVRRQLLAAMMAACLSEQPRRNVRFTSAPKGR